MPSGEPQVLEGYGVHGGRSSRVTLARREGPVALRRAGHEARVDELCAVGTERATTVARADGAVRLATVEHLFAALAAHGVHRGIVIDVEGDELPLLDGAAAAWSRALALLGAPAGGPRLEVLRDAEVRVDGSVYAFARAPATTVAIRFETDDPRLAADASWGGDIDDFRARIAPARTFAFAHELEALRARGLGAHASPESVVVIGHDAVHAAGAPFSADEPARHKLLDLLGDLYLYGGPPRGAVHATRPGHRATHEAMRRALELGALVRRPGG